MNLYAVKYKKRGHTAIAFLIKICMLHRVLSNVSGTKLELTIGTTKAPQKVKLLSVSLKPSLISADHSIICKKK